MHASRWLCSSETQSVEKLDLNTSTLALRAQCPAAFLLVGSGIWLQLWQQPEQLQGFSQAKLTWVISNMEWEQHGLDKEGCSSQHCKRRQFGGGTRELWLSTSATTRESKREHLPIRKQLQLHLQTASFVTFEPTLHLPGQVKGSAWPCRTLA